MISRLSYYLLIKPLSYLPLAVLYRLSDLAFILLFYGLKYRRRVVWSNLRRSYPDRQEAALRRVERRFYRHFCDLMVESIRVFSMPADEAVRRCRVVNPQVFQPYFEQGQTVIAVGGHYGNWEFASMAFNPQLPHRVAAIYSPLKNAFFDRLIQSSRTRTDVRLISRRLVGQYFEQLPAEPEVIFFMGDQSPSSSEMKQHWTIFLRQETGVVLGAEKYARQYNLPVFFTELRRTGRGRYEAEFTLITDDSARTPDGYISERHTRMLEWEIDAAPAYWLWTHRRWKHPRPAAVPLWQDTPDASTG